MQTARKRVVIAVIAFLAMMGMALPAQAAGGSFDWTASMTCCQYSRNWTTTTTADIWIDVDSISPASNGYTVQLYKVRTGLPDNLVGSTRSGGVGTDMVWRSVPPGVYHFYIVLNYPARDTATFQLAGSVAYDGRTT